MTGFPSPVPHRHGQECVGLHRVHQSSQWGTGGIFFTCVTRVYLALKREMVDGASPGGEGLHRVSSAVIAN
jgi:hypothetical protein